MTLWAVLSDIHGRADRLRRALADGRAAGARRFLALGDLGSTTAMDLLNDHGAQFVFGNWEASGLRGLPWPYRGQVARWPQRLQLSVFWAAHATPVWPDGLGCAEVVEYLREHDLHWTALFPSLQRSDDARWAALAALDAADAPLLLHGHTHIQEAWRWQPGAAPLRVSGDQGEATLVAGERWLIGVGSVGDPHDGGGICYALYDDEAWRLTWRRI
jgi:predicted phosphodiesterase